MRKGFTMLELVFIIVVIGILAAVMIPRMDRDNVSEAAIDLQSQIRYTQHLALINDKFDPNNATWFENRWRIRFNNNTYSIVSGDDASTDFALDSQTNNPINGVDFKAKYNVNIILNCNGAQSISFDHVGRPILGISTQPYNRAELLQADQNCTIFVTDDNNQTVHALRLHAETGYLEGI